jgi:hypothetical protein
MPMHNELNRAEAAPALLDVVPWSHGYAHSWALAWLIENGASRDRVLALLDPDGSPPWMLSDSVKREHKVAGARTDLAVWAKDGTGREVAIAVETKVADPIKPAQLACYRDAGYHAVLYVPGLTGLLYEPNGPVAGERWVTGKDVARAVEGAELPWIISSYVEAVAAEARRMDDARAFSRDELDDFSHEGQAQYDDLMDAAWIVEVIAAMRAAGADDITVRTEANDRGLYWGGSWRQVAVGNGADLYVDVIADLRTHACAVAVKVGSGDQEGRWACYDAAIAAGSPSSAPWRYSRRRSGNTGTVWKLDASEMNAHETARHVIAAGDFIARLAARDAEAVR